jgi:hypothetical protein
MYSHQDFLDFCNRMGWDPDCPYSYTEWCYYNDVLAP